MPAAHLYVGLVSRALLTFPCVGSNGNSHTLQSPQSLANTLSGKDNAFFLQTLRLAHRLNLRRVGVYGGEITE